MLNSRVWLEIDANKIQANISKIKSYIGEKKLAVVLKANAYGLGLDLLLDILKDSNIEAIGVAEADTAIKVKNRGIKTFIMGALIESEFEDIVINNIISPIGDLETALKLNEIAKTLNKKLDCQLVIDSGMGRLGFLADSKIDLFKKLLSFDNLNFIGIYSHFPQAYNDKDFSLVQIKKFLSLAENLKKIGYNFNWTHIANSDGIQNVKECFSEPFNMVRVGINIYGLFDQAGQVSIDLEDAVSLKTQIIQIRDMPKGHPIGYGKTHILSEPRRIATLPIGYADGLSAKQSNSGSVYISEKKCPIIGRVSMDFTTIDITHIPEAKVGDIVVCFSNNSDVRDFAHLSGVSVYEVLTSIGQRVKRVRV